MKRPLPDIAVISLPSRFVSIPGTYKCIPDGANSENSKACQFHKSQKEGEESQDKSVNEVQLQNPVERLPEKQHDQEGKRQHILFVNFALKIVNGIISCSSLPFISDHPEMRRYSYFTTYSLEVPVRPILGKNSS